jgi:hypothetical protein
MVHVWKGKDYIYDFTDATNANRSYIYSYQRKVSTKGHLQEENAKQILHVVLNELTLQRVRKNYRNHR